jgi:hypothetical protein
VVGGLVKPGDLAIDAFKVAQYPRTAGDGEAVFPEPPGNQGFQVVVGVGVTTGPDVGADATGGAVAGGQVVPAVFANLGGFVEEDGGDFGALKVMGVLVKAQVAKDDLGPGGKFPGEGGDFEAAPR